MLKVTSNPQQANLCHNNICIQNVAVDINGNWLFIGLEHMSKMKKVLIHFVYNYLLNETINLLFITVSRLCILIKVWEIKRIINFHFLYNINLKITNRKIRIILNY